MSDTKLDAIASMLTGESKPKDIDADDYADKGQPVNAIYKNEEDLIPERSLSYEEQQKANAEQDGEDSYQEQEQGEQVKETMAQNQKTINPQQLKQQYGELENAVNQLNQMAQNNEISQQQYQAAMVNAQQMHMGLQQQNLDMQQSQIQYSQKQERFNASLNDSIPGWSDPNRRENIQRNMVDHYCAQTGCSREEAISLGRQMDPQSLTYIYKSMEASKPKPIKRKPKPKQKRKAKVDTSYRRGTDAQASAIGELLTNLGVVR